MKHNYGSVVFGLLLVFAGIFFLASNFGVLRGENFLIFLGLAFVVSYYFTGRQVGLLVPGFVLIALGSFFSLQHLWWFRPRQSGGWLFIFLGLAFAMVFIVDSVGRPHPTVWPLFPGAGLLVFGLIVTATEVLPRAFWHFTGTWWPALLILLGLAILLRPSH